MTILSRLHSPLYSIVFVIVTLMFSINVIADNILKIDGVKLSRSQRIQFERALAFRWAPVHHQDVDRTGKNGLRGKSDYLTAVNFDGDWNAKNNWENTKRLRHRLRGAAYYSIVASRTHWFIIYAFFHPRDWDDKPLIGKLDEHENDMEGALLVVRRPKKFGMRSFGRLEAMVTVYHLDFYSFIPRGSRYRKNRETIDGRIRFVRHGRIRRPVTAQQAKGHGLKAWPYVKIKGGDGIVYYPSLGNVRPPRHNNDRRARYKLINIFARGGLWDRRYRHPTFTRKGQFRGDNGKDNAANPPWKWDDHNDGGRLRGGELAKDPIKLIRIYFKNLGRFSRRYTSNRYRGI